MTINRLIYILTLALSFVFYLLYPPWFSWYLFVLVLLMVPIDLIISLPGMLKKGIVMSIPAVLEKGDDAVLKLITTSNKTYPIRCIIAKLRVTGDSFSTSCRIKCSPENGSQREVTIDTSHSGITVFYLKKIKTVSLLGLFSLPLNIKGSGSVLILPPPVKPKDTMALQHGTSLRPKPGGGFSEEHDMRIYRQGDPIRSIHWKVSAKYDSLVIREPLEPPPHSRLVHAQRWNNEIERDIILGRLRWVTEYLLKWQMPFYVKVGEDTAVSEVDNEYDLIDYLCYALGATGTLGTTGALGTAVKKKAKLVQTPLRYSWIYRIDASVAEDIKKVESYVQQFPDTERYELTVGT